MVLVVSFQTTNSGFSGGDLCGLRQLLTDRIRMVLVVSFQTTNSGFSGGDLCGLRQLLTDRIRVVLVVFFQTTHFLFSDRDMYGFSQHLVDIKSSHRITTAQEEEGKEEGEEAEEEKFAYPRMNKPDVKLSVRVTKINRLGGVGGGAILTCYRGRILTRLGKLIRLFRLTSVCTVSFNHFFSLNQHRSEKHAGPQRGKC